MTGSGAQGSVELENGSTESEISLRQSTVSGRDGKREMGAGLGQLCRRSSVSERGGRLEEKGFAERKRESLPSRVWQRLNSLWFQSSIQKKGLGDWIDQSCWTGMTPPREVLRKEA